MADVVAPWITAADLTGCTAAKDASTPDIAKAIAWASTFAWEVSDRTVGLLTATRIFCVNTCRCIVPSNAYWGDRWGKHCECLPGRRLDLGRRGVVDVTEIILDPTGAAPVTVPLDQFRVLAGQYLVYTDGTAWTYGVDVQVTYVTGVVPDVFDQDAVAALACEKLKSLRNLPCALPEGMESFTTGTGTRVRMVDPFDKRLAGLPPIPRFYEWALTKFKNPPGGILDPSDPVTSYPVTWIGVVTP